MPLAVSRFDPDGTPNATFADCGTAVGERAEGGGGADDQRAALIAGFNGADPEGTGDDDAAITRLQL